MTDRLDAERTERPRPALGGPDEKWLPEHDATGTASPESPSGLDRIGLLSTVRRHD